MVQLVSLFVVALVEVAEAEHLDKWLVQVVLVICMVAVVLVEMLVVTVLQQITAVWV
jgi:hypothetical protein